MFEYLEKSPVRFQLFQFCSYYFGNNFLIAEGRVRINLAKLLMYMFREEKKRTRFRKGWGMQKRKGRYFFHNWLAGRAAPPALPQTSGKQAAASVVLEQRACGCWDWAPDELEMYCVTSHIYIGLILGCIDADLCK